MSILMPEHYGKIHRYCYYKVRNSVVAYPLTMGHTALLLAICTFLASMMTAAITMLLSARLKSPFAVIIPITLPLIATAPLNIIRLARPGRA